MTTAAAIRNELENPSAGGRLMAVDGRELPLLGTRVSSDVRGGLARITLEQRFTNRYLEPLNVTYLFPLPHDAAVSGYAFRVGDRRIVGEVDLVENARERFEEALLEGKSAALLEQERGSVFTQNIGNVPPGREVVVDVTLDQRLAWTGTGWEWRFPTALAPRYQGAPGRVRDAERITVDIADGEVAPRLSLSLVIRDDLLPDHVPESTSHALQIAASATGVCVSFAGEQGAALDRDLVVRWPIALARPGLTLDACRPQTGRLDGQRAFGLLTLVPPAEAASIPSLRRDLIVLLDTSGSMDGWPLQHAKAITSALVRSLGPEDTLELVAFSDRPRRWTRGAAQVTEELRADALTWIGGLEAGGGTEMREGILEALRPLRPEAQRQVILVTDGEIGFEQEVVSAVLHELPDGSRLHAVGVGDAVNRSLTSPVARAGRGVEVVVGLRDDPSAAAASLVARTRRPLVTGLIVEGSAVVAQPPSPLPDLFGASPVLVPLELRPEGGEVVVRGSVPGGSFVHRLEMTPITDGGGSSAPASFFARESVEALELRLAAGEDRETIDARIRELGIGFQIATRLTAWIAVSEEPTVDPKVPFRRERMPQMLPHGLSMEGLGLRACSTAPGELALAEFSHASMRPGRLYELACPPKREDQLRATYAWQGKKLVVTIEVVGEELTWNVPPGALLATADGDLVRCSVDREATTASSLIGPGQSFRVVLDWDRPDRPLLGSLKLSTHGVHIAISLREP